MNESSPSATSRESSDDTPHTEALRYLCRTCIPSASQAMETALDQCAEMERELNVRRKEAVALTGLLGKARAERDALKSLPSAARESCEDAWLDWKRTHAEFTDQLDGTTLANMRTAWGIAWIKASAPVSSTAECLPLDRLKAIRDEAIRLHQHAASGYPVDRMDLNNHAFRLGELVKSLSSAKQACDCRPWEGVHAADCASGFGKPK